MMRWIILGFLIWLVARFYLVGRRRRAANDKSVTVSLVRCAHCGVHVSIKDAIQAGEHHYCSPDHCEKGPVHA